MKRKCLLVFGGCSASGYCSPQLNVLHFGEPPIREDSAIKSAERETKSVEAVLFWQRSQEEPHTKDEQWICSK